MVHQTQVDLGQHEDILRTIFNKIQAASEWSPERLTRIVRRYPLPGGRTPSKSQLLQSYRELCVKEGRAPDQVVVQRLRAKPTNLILMTKRLVESV